MVAIKPFPYEPHPAPYLTMPDVCLDPAETGHLRQLPGCFPVDMETWCRPGQIPWERLSASRSTLSGGCLPLPGKNLSCNEITEIKLNMMLSYRLATSKNQRR